MGAPLRPRPDNTELSGMYVWVLSGMFVWERSGQGLITQS